MESVACDLCGSVRATPVARQTDLLHRTTSEIFSIVRCDQCGLHFTNPRPSPSEMARYYGEDYSFHAAPPRWKNWLGVMLDYWANSPLAVIAALVPPLSGRLAARVRPRLRDPVEVYYRGGGQGAFLDIGCGAGIHAHYWGSQGALRAYRKLAAVSGIEVSDRARQALTEAGIEAWADLEAVPPDRRFGMIRMNWSLEHVHSPERYFRFIAERLIPGGRALIAVPNYEGMLYRLAPDCVEVPVHLYHFRPQDIEAYARRHDLVVREMTKFSYPAMFQASGEAGLLPGSFALPLSVLAARRMLRVLAPFDQAGWGNDLIAVLEARS